MFVQFSDIITTHDRKRICGNFSTTENGNSDSGPNKLTVVFRTNRNRQNNGFFMVATCVSPDFGDLKGCTRDQLRIIPAPFGRRNNKTQMVIHYIRKQVTSNLSAYLIAATIVHV